MARPYVPRGGGALKYRLVIGSRIERLSGLNTLRACASRYLQPWTTAKGATFDTLKPTLLLATSTSASFGSTNEERLLVAPCDSAFQLTQLVLQSLKLRSKGTMRPPFMTKWLTIPVGSCGITRSSISSSPRHSASPRCNQLGSGRFLRVEFQVCCHGLLGEPADFGHDNIC
jgi:hypothetical protein